MAETRYSFEELLKKDGFIVYTNVGFSMMPLLRQRRDIIEIRAKGPGRCRKYDVVLYRRGEKYILHRILKVLPDGYVNVTFPGRLLPGIFPGTVLPPALTQTLDNPCILLFN